jgi:hypothetical protein
LSAAPIAQHPVLKILSEIQNILAYSSTRLLKGGIVFFSGSWRMPKKGWAHSAAVRCRVGAQIA